MTISADHYDELVTIRHHIHENPELSGQEFETTAYLKAYLEGLNIEILETGLKTGLVAQVGQGEPVIALRADIDALPILENTGLSFASKNAGVMHACGHDLHQTSLLGAAKILKQREAELKGTVKLIFQHAEEAHFGASEVLDTGILSDVQAIIGYHNMPTLPVGQIGIRAKGVMAAVDQFFVTVTGVGSHAAYPASFGRWARSGGWTTTVTMRKRKPTAESMLSLFRTLQKNMKSRKWARQPAMPSSKR